MDAIRLMDGEKERQCGHSDVSSIPQGHTTEQKAWACAHIMDMGPFC